MHINQLYIENSIDFLHVVLNSINSAFVIVDKHHNVKAYNKVFEEMFTNAHLTDFENKSVGEIISCPYTGEGNKSCGLNLQCNFCVINNAIQETFETRQSLQNQYFYRELREENVNEKRYFSFSSAHIRYQEQDMVVLVMDDITAQENYKLQLEKQNEQLISINEHKNRFLSIASHDLRNPIAAIQACASIILKTLDNPSDDVSRLLEIIFGKSQYALNLISDLLDYSKIESGNLSLFVQSHDYKEFLERIVENHQIILNQKNILLRLDYHTENTSLDFDRDRLEQVFNNLIDNAYKYSPKNTDINIVVTNENDHMVTKVRDHGPGIPESEKEKIFSAFHKVESEYNMGKNGTGLGLAIVKKILESHEGTIQIDSTEGEGCTFILSLPL